MTASHTQDTRESASDTISAMRQTPFDLIGGHPVIAAIVDRFHDLMDHDASYAELRAMHAPDLTPMRASLAGFLAAWAGGPRDWFEGHPGKCMMSIHKNMAISRPVADQWASAMRRAINEAGPSDPLLRREMGEVLGWMAVGMARPG